MALQEAAEAAIALWRDPDTDRDLVRLCDLLGLAEGLGLEVDNLPLALGQLMRAGAEVLSADLDGREVVLVRMPADWRAQVTVGE